MEHSGPCEVEHDRSRIGSVQHSASSGQTVSGIDAEIRNVIGVAVGCRPMDTPSPAASGTFPRETLTPGVGLAATGSDFDGRRGVADAAGS